MSRNSVREKIRRGEPSLGTYMGMGSATVAELLAEAGMEWLVIETEHNAVDWADVQAIMMAIKGTSTIPLVRVPSQDPIHIQKALDIGALGVVVPMIRSSEEARTVVAATRYPPEGTRGYGPLRATRYTLDSADYFAQSNESMLTVFIIETKEAAENLEAIASVPGVDVLYLGPFDLCLSLGLDPMKQPHREIEEVFERMLKASRTHGVAIGTNVMDAAQLHQRRTEGATLLGWRTDYVMLLGSAREGLAAFTQPGHGDKPTS